MPQSLADSRDPVNACYYGEGGTGKTSALAAMANQGPIVLVNAESGIKERPLKKLGVKTENIQIFPGPDEELTFDGLEKLWVQMREDLHKDPDAWAGIGWDSITEIQKALLDNVVAKAVVKADRAGKERDPFFIALEDYGVVTEQIRSLVRRFRDLPCHFAVTALSRRMQDDDGSVTYQPAVTPALQNDLIGWVDMVCCTSVAQVDGEDEYRGLFRPHSKFRGKDRLGAMPKWLVDPSFDRILQYVEGELTSDTDPVMDAARERAQREKAKQAEKEK